jgi:S1-C subfamily serine protease
MEEQKRQRGCGYAVIAVLVIAGLLLTTGGGVLLGWLIGRGTISPSPVAQPSPTREAVRPTQVTHVTVTEDSAIVEAVAEVKPAVVTVINTLPPQRDIFGQVVEPQASGSGVIISEGGYIVTNNHVVENSQSLEVIYADDTKVPATLIGADVFSDLAVVQVAGEVPDVAELGDSATLQPGEPAIAIGSPLGVFKGTVTVGVVSAVDRRLEVAEGLWMEGLIQTDAAINQGNSGGPLINSAGQVIGINTAIVRGSQLGAVAEGLGFAIASNTVKEVSEQIIQFGKVRRPYLGVQWVPVDPQVASAYELPAEFGAYVQEVEPGTAADRAGLKPGDIITAIDGQPIDEDNGFVTVLMRFDPGDEVELTVVRDGREIMVNVTLGTRE